MKRVTNYLKMRVLGALEYAKGDSDMARYQARQPNDFSR